MTWIKNEYIGSAGNRHSPGMYMYYSVNIITIILRASRKMKTKNHNGIKNQNPTFIDLYLLHSEESVNNRALIVV